MKPHLKEVQKLQTISLLSHVSKVLLSIILNRLKNKSYMNKTVFCQILTAEFGPCILYSVKES